MATSNPFDSDYPHARRPASHSSSALWLFLVLLGLVVGGLVGWFVSRPGSSGLNPEAQPLPVVNRGPLLSLEQTNIAIYEKTSPSVVHVSNLAEGRSRFSLNVQQILQGTGSGFVWDDQGHIVTNFHVVKDADAVQVTLPDHSSYQSDQVWAYPDKDIAVIWIKAPRSKLHPIRMGSSHNLKVGQMTYAIGNPFGLDQTLTTGVVSALGREITSVTNRPIRGVIQTSAAINPGNSGGPLFDSDGLLIGMNTAILSPSGAFAGIGFAIPVDEVNRVVPQLIAHGTATGPPGADRGDGDRQARRPGGSPMPPAWVE